MKHALLVALSLATIASSADAKPRTAGEAARALIAALETRDRAAALALFADSAVAEYPFDRSGRTEPGASRRFEGKAAVEKNYIDNALKNITRIDYFDEVVTESRDGRTAFVEARGDMDLAKGIGNGTPYRNRYVIKVVTDRDGRIVQFAEYMNPVAAALATGAPLGAAAVAPPPAPPPGPRPLGPGTDRCDAAKARFAVGAAFDAALLERARTAAGAAVARRLHPDQPVTMEYRGDRLNLMVGTDGKVSAVRCG